VAELTVPPVEGGRTQIVENDRCYVPSHYDHVRHRLSWASTLMRPSL